MNTMKTIEVVAAVIIDNNKILATKRASGEFINMWEFPGGKIEQGETNEVALKREILEELEVEIDIEKFIMTINYDYPNFHLIMHCYLCTLKNKNIKLNVHNDAKWFLKEELSKIKWVPADIEVANKVKTLVK